MTTEPLSLEAFQHLLDRHGGTLARWPETDAQAAHALLAKSPEARALLADAQLLDTALADTPKAPEGLVARIMAASGAKK